MNPFRQLVTHWGVTGLDGFGHPTFDSPRAIKGRWEDRTEQFLLPSGEISVSRAVVFVPSDEWDIIAIGDYIALGTQAAENPTTLQEAYSIRQRIKTPDLRLVRNEVRLLV